MPSQTTPLSPSHRNAPATIAAITALICTLIYSGMKVVMAIRGEIGLPGFPAKDASYVGRSSADISRDEWGLVLTGLVAALVALVTLLPVIRRVPRWIVAIAVWVAGLSQAAGAVTFTFRTLRILPDLGPGPQGWSTWVVLLILDVGAIAWLMLSWLITRHGPPGGSTAHR